MLIKRYWPLMFFLVPVSEIYLIIAVGSRIGALWTVTLVIFTAFIGVNLLRVQGLSTLQRAQTTMASGQMPASEMAEGMLLAIGGILLLTPGFITDTLGLLCLFPVSRRMLASRMMAQARFVSSAHAPGFSTEKVNTPRGRATKPRPGENVIEGEYERHD